MLDSSSAAIREFAAGCKYYLELINQSGELDLHDLLESVHIALADLYSLGNKLPQVDTDAFLVSETTANSFEELETMRIRLAAKLGDLDSYWEILDPYVFDGPVAFTLSEALADIYDNLFAGLEMFNADYRYNEAAATEYWKDLDHHWGDHLINVLKVVRFALRLLKSRSCIQLPQIS